MDRRWIRIDQAHRVFEYSDVEFGAILAVAQSASGLVNDDRNQGSLSANPMKLEADSKLAIVEKYQLVEAINAELAEFASLQRQERFIQNERNRIAQEQAQVIQGQLLAQLFAASLRQNS